MTRHTIVAGVGMVPFTKPGRSASYDIMGRDAVRAALADAGIAYTEVQQAYAVPGAETGGRKAPPCVVTIYRQAG